MVKTKVGGHTDMPERVRWVLIIGISTILTLVGGRVGVLSSPAGEQIYIAEECGHRLVRISDMTGAGWTTLGNFGTGINQFTWPQAIFVSRAGQIFVADTGSSWSREPPGNHRIVRIDNMTGAGWTTFGTRGDGVGQFEAPRGVFVSTAGQIFVADSGNNRVVRINGMTGAGWTVFGGIGSNRLEGPSKVFVSHNGQIYILDWGKRRIVRINDMSGTGWTTFGTLGQGVNQFGMLTDIFVAPSGQIYATDINHIVRINDMTGTGWTILGGFTGGLESIFVTSNGQILVGEYDRITRLDEMTGAGRTTFRPGETGTPRDHFCGAHAFVR